MPEINTYDVGDRIELEARFRDENGELADPDTITVKVLAGDGGSTTYVYGVDGALDRDSAGVYRLELTVDEPGDWAVRWIGTGAVEQAGGRRFTVRTPEVP